MQAKRFNSGKPQMFWLDAWPHALEELAEVFAGGAIKYASYNYKLGAPASESYACARRHMIKYWNGEEYDTDLFELTGKKISHLAFAIWNLARILDETKNPGPGTVDDRPFKIIEELMNEADKT